jgi:hypothetical protein
MLRIAACLVACGLVTACGDFFENIINATPNIEFVTVVEPQSGAEEEGEIAFTFDYEVSWTEQVDIVLVEEGIFGTQARAALDPDPPEGPHLLWTPSGVTRDMVVHVSAVVSKNGTSRKATTSVDLQWTRLPSQVPFILDVSVTWDSDQQFTVGGDAAENPTVDVYGRVRMELIQQDQGAGRLRDWQVEIDGELVNEGAYPLTYFTWEAGEASLGAHSVVIKAVRADEEPTEMHFILNVVNNP